MTERQLIHIKREDWKKSIDFMKALYSSVLPGSWQIFEKIEADKDPFSRLPDLEVLADEYIDAMDTSTSLTLALSDLQYQPQTGKTRHTITVAVRNVYLPDSPEIERFAWYHAPKTQQNIISVADIFTEAFKISPGLYRKKQQDS